MREFIFTVPLIPPSVNHYKMPRAGGGYYVTKEAAGFTDAVCIFARNTANFATNNFVQPWPTPIVDGEFYSVDVAVFQLKKKFLRGDSDNMEKVLFDSLTKAGVIRDDRYITRHTHRRIPVDSAHDERTEYIIRGIDEP